MKRVITAIVIAVIAVVGIVMAAEGKENDEYIRLHIRANSNSEYDQSIKYKVKDRVVDYLTPISVDMSSKKQMYKILGDNLDGIKICVDNELKRLGQNYTCRVRLTEEEFPTRTYQDLTLEAGLYDALIIELGAGVGDNWWCVAFPPLCFNGEDNGSGKVIYKSKITEWFKEIFG